MSLAAQDLPQTLLRELTRYDFPAPPVGWEGDKLTPQIQIQIY